MRPLKTIPLILLVFVSSGIASCAFIEERPETVRLIVQAATLKVIDGDPDKAARVVEIASDVRRISSATPELTVSALITTVRGLIKWGDLEAEQVLLVEALLLELQYRLEDRLGPEPLPEQLRLTVNQITTWIIDTASIAA